MTAFQLATHRDVQDPLYTIRRIIASGYWSAHTLHKKMAASFDAEENILARSLALTAQTRIPSR